jgi:hypothetical protein
VKLLPFREAVMMASASQRGVVKMIVNNRNHNNRWFGESPRALRTRRNTQYHLQHGHPLSRSQAFGELAPNNTSSPAFAHISARVANNTLWPIV